MSTMQLESYEGRICRILGCSADHAMEIAHIMRDDVLHTVALDWLSEEEFEKAARGATKLFDANRADYEQYFAAAEAAFQQMRASQAPGA